MAVHERCLIVKVTCDATGCDREIIPTADAATATYTDAFCTFIERRGWSMWAGRGRRFYCTEHGPRPGHTMRRIELRR